MPFPKQTPRPFTRSDVESLTPNQLGCYGLFAPDLWIYVGKGDIRQRLLDHLNGDNDCIKKSKPTQWVGVVTNDMDAEEKRLIRELGPCCNQRVG
jgi:hypothetical protein